MQAAIDFVELEFRKYKSLVKEIPVGKQLRDALYIHESAIDALPKALGRHIAKTIFDLGLEDEDWNIIKFSRRDHKITLLHYPSFFEEAYPALACSYTIDLEKHSCRKTNYRDSDNPPILHRKETFLKPDHPQVPVFQEITEEGERAGLYEKPRLIGFKQNWERLIRRKGYALDKNGRLVPLCSQQAGRPSVPVLNQAIERHRTAIDRHKLSVPMQFLARHDYFSGDFSVLDYGCGKGDDLRELEMHGIDVSGWDPVYRTDSHKTRADIVNLGYVINVIEDRAERDQALKDAYAHTKKLLCVSVMLGSEATTAQFTPYKDGVITQRNTFQKYFTQSELRSYLETTLDESAVAAGPGLFLVFKDKDEEQLFLSSRQKVRRHWQHLAIAAMRDSGYRTTAHAIAELIDNSQQAEATEISIFCFEEAEQLKHHKVRRVKRIAVLDNGEGMSPDILRQALQFGNGTRLSDRSGIGRFGMGLPNASISQARKVEVWAWQNGPDNAMQTYLDVERIQNQDLTTVPRPEHMSVPTEYHKLAGALGRTGTLVVWSDLDPARLTWRGAKATLANTEKLVGRIHRRFISNGGLVIRLVTVVDGDILAERFALANDPLYLMDKTSTPDPFSEVAMFENMGDSKEFPIEYKGDVHKVKVSLSLAGRSTLDKANGMQRGDTKYGRHAAENVGVSLVRANRELTLDRGWAIAYDPRERWWGAEVEFPPALDEIFGVTNNKQEATIFSSLANFRLEEDAQPGETLTQFQQRLREYGDPRADLLGVAEYLQRQLKLIRGRIKEQGKGKRRTAKRHDPDDVTKRASDGFRRRYEGGYKAPTDVKEPSIEDLEQIRRDLENKRYDDPEAASIVGQIKENDLKCVFLRADQDTSAFFSVEEKPGGLTEIVFNQTHPAFDFIWGTLGSSVDIGQLSDRELLEAVDTAHDAMKLLFAAWARYEVEESARRKQQFRKTREDWGIIARQFLDPTEFDD